MPQGKEHQRKRRQIRGATKREAERHGRKPTNKTQVKHLHAHGHTYAEIAERTGLGVPTVWVIVHHGSWAQYQRNKRSQA